MAHTAISCSCNCRPQYPKMRDECWKERLVLRQKPEFIIKSGIGNTRGFSVPILISTSIIQKLGCVWEPNETHPASVSPQGKPYSLTPKGWQMLRQNYYLCVTLIIMLHLKPKHCRLWLLSEVNLTGRGLCSCYMGKLSTGAGP